MVCRVRWVTVAAGLVAGCVHEETSTTRPWTESDVVVPVHKSLDADADGHLTAEEYSVGAVAAPPFERLDEDRDQDLSALELVHMVRVADPLSFDGRRARRRPTPADVEVYFPLPLEVRVRRDAYRFLVDELRARSPELELPDNEALVAAAQETGSERSLRTEVHAVLAAACETTGVPQPRFLSGSDPASESP